MALENKIATLIRSRNNHDLPPTAGVLTEMNWTQEDRMKNALRVFGICALGHWSLWRILF
jgi:hypothetical protein